MAEKVARELAREFAHPEWMVERWVREYGWETAREICRHDQTVPQTAVRLRRAGVEAELASDAVRLGAGKVMAGARVVQGGDVTKSAAFREGGIVIQDEGSQLVAALAGAVAKSGARILDCCAAPGGKTLAMADGNPRAKVMAVELHGHRARLMKKLLGRAGAAIWIVNADARKMPVCALFDRVLADVPCSGTGTLGRNPEIKWRLRPEDLIDLQKRQLEILRAALAQAAPGGRVIYSTCSLEREENEEVVENVVAEDGSFRVVDCGEELRRLKELVWDAAALVRGKCLRTVPGVHPCDGFFAAVVERISHGFRRESSGELRSPGQPRAAVPT